MAVVLAYQSFNSPFFVEASSWPDSLCEGVVLTGAGDGGSMRSHSWSRSADSRTGSGESGDGRVGSAGEGLRRFGSWGVDCGFVGWGSGDSQSVPANSSFVGGKIFLMCGLNL